MADNMTSTDIGEALAALALEMMAVLAPDAKGADELLEKLAGNILTMTEGMVPGPVCDALSTCAEKLIACEGPAAPKG